MSDQKPGDQPDGKPKAPASEKVERTGFIPIRPSQLSDIKKPEPTRTIERRPDSTDNLYAALQVAKTRHAQRQAELSGRTDDVKEMDHTRNQANWREKFSSPQLTRLTVIVVVLGAAGLALTTWLKSKEQAGTESRGRAAEAKPAPVAPPPPAPVAITPADAGNKVSDSEREAARKADEARRAEEQRKAEETRRADEARKAEEEATAARQRERDQEREAAERERAERERQENEERERREREAQQAFDAQQAAPQPQQ